MKQLLIALSIGLLLGAALLYFAWARPALDRARNQEQQRDTIVFRDTVIFRDTVLFPKPVPVEHRIVDTIQVVTKDTVLVTLPREEVVYSDTSYYAVVSGFQPRLDTLKVFPEQRAIYIEKTIQAPQKRWGLSVVGGGGFGAQGLTPFVGVGVSWDILQW